ncbi:hypothetical protein EGW08_006028, partial [Elysia chlorotica]
LPASLLDGHEGKGSVELQNVQAEIVPVKAEDLNPAPSPPVSQQPPAVAHDKREEFDQKATTSLGGAAAARLEQLRLKDSGKSSNAPDLLELEGEFGWSDRVPQRIYEKFSSEGVEGKDLKCLTFQKTSDLGVALEGGRGSPLEGRIVVSMVFDDGVAFRSGKIKVGDQLMMINGRQLLDLTLAEAENALHEVSTSPRDRTVELIYCESRLVNDED